MMSSVVWSAFYPVTLPRRERQQYGTILSCRQVASGWLNPYTVGH
jgi:hypothetical protein